jgi:hypothetical protein
VSDLLDEGRAQLVELVVSHKQLHDEEAAAAVVAPMIHVKLEEHLREHQDDYRDEFDQPYYHEMTAVGVGVDWVKELEYVDC